MYLHLAKHLEPCLLVLCFETWLFAKRFLLRGIFFRAVAIAADIRGGQRRRSGKRPRKMEEDGSSPSGFSRVVPLPCYFLTSDAVRRRKEDSMSCFYVCHRCFVWPQTQTQLRSSTGVVARKTRDPWQRLTDAIPETTWKKTWCFIKLGPVKSASEAPFTFSFPNINWAFATMKAKNHVLAECGCIGKGKLIFSYQVFSLGHTSLIWKANEGGTSTICLALCFYFWVFFWF